MSYPITDIDGIAGEVAATLKSVGIRSTERLLEAALNGAIPLSVAIEISKADTPETQRELLKGFETKQLNRLSIRSIKRLIDQRRLLGKAAGLGLIPNDAGAGSAAPLAGPVRILRFIVRGGARDTQYQRRRECHHANRNAVEHAFPLLNERPRPSSRRGDWAQGYTACK